MHRYCACAGLPSYHSLYQRAHSHTTIRHGELFSNKRTLLAEQGELMCRSVREGMATPSTPACPTSLYYLVRRMGGMGGRMARLYEDGADGKGQKEEK